MRWTLVDAEGDDVTMQPRLSDASALLLMGCRYSSVSVDNHSRCEMAAKWCFV